jgi:hypothetical protein
MINGINSSGRYTIVSGGNSSNPYISPGSAGAGMMRYNPNTNNIEVNDGNTWLTMSTSYATVGLSQEAESLLDWAREQRNKQFEYEILAKENSAVRIAMENVEKAKQQLTITANLAKDSQNDHGEVMAQASP